MTDLPFFAQVYMVFLLFLVGLVMGSGLNCLSYRIAHEEKWSSGRSKCPACGHTLHFFDLIPLFSWIFLKGKCRYCGKKISIRYPITELVLAIAYAALLIRYGLTLETAVTLVLVSCLFCLSLVDIETRIIPDRFLLIPAILRLAELFYIGGWKNVWYGLYHGLILGGSVLVIALIMDRVLHKESMGGGDIKLLFMLGLFFDLPTSLLLLFLACILGLAAALMVMRLGRDTPFPFGPFISLSAFISLLAGEAITGWYLSFF